MRRKKQRRFAGTESEMDVSMTPMIDVVFQLLIYFLVTFSTADVLAHLDVSRPSPDAAQREAPGEMIRVEVMPTGYAINGRRVSEEELGILLRRLASISAKQTVLVVCDDQSLHGKLIQVLDLCAESGLTKISVMSGQ